LLALFAFRRAPMADSDRLANLATASELLAQEDADPVASFRRGEPPS
jgi:hypothetical protein